MAPGSGLGPGARGPRPASASAGPEHGLPPPLLGLSSGDSVGGGVAVRFSFRGGGWGPGSGGSSVSCVWVLSTESSPQGCVTQAGVPRLPGQCWRSERLAIHGVQRPRPRACGGPCWPWPWPWPSDWGTPVCLCLRRPLLTRPVEPLGDSGATPSFPHCPSPGPRLPRGGRDLSS